MQTQESKSSGDRLRAAATGQALAKKEPTSFPQMLSAYKNQIAMALPKHMNGDRMARVALTCFRQNPKLADCQPASVFAAIIIGAQLGLEPGIMGQAYLVPYKDECQFIPGWQGLVDLVNRSGRASVWTGAVFQGDDFKYEYGSDPFIHHVPAGNDDQPDKLTHVYAVGKVKGAEQPVIEVWSVAKVTRHRDKYNKVGKRHYSFENFEMYARKVALLQVIKYMPKSIELSLAVGMSHAADGGQIIDIKDAIEGTFLPAPSEAVDQTTGEITQQQTAPTVESAVSYLKTATTVAELQSYWEIVRQQYTDAGASIPIDVEATNNDHRETLKQADAKRRS